MAWFLSLWCSPANSGILGVWKDTQQVVCIYYGCCCDSSIWQSNIDIIGNNYESKGQCCNPNVWLKRTAMNNDATNQINLIQQNEYNGTVKKACFIHNRKTSFTGWLWHQYQLANWTDSIFLGTSICSYTHFGNIFKH